MQTVSFSRKTKTKTHTHTQLLWEPQFHFPYRWLKYSGWDLSFQKQHWWMLHRSGFSEKLAQNWAALMEMLETSRGLCCVMLQQAPGFAQWSCRAWPPRLSYLLTPEGKQLRMKLEPGSFLVALVVSWFLLLLISTSPGGHLLHSSLTSNLRETLSSDNLCPVHVCLFSLDRWSLVRKIRKKSSLSC